MFQEPGGTFKGSSGDIPKNIQELSLLHLFVSLFVYFKEIRLGVAASERFLQLRPSVKGSLMNPTQF